ncbi:RNA-dependent RNA polymerase [Colletotrichum fructicola mitovirus 1]|nr:RNA-dependent RNA polymerase [Colletotrichum fructicola mitovirus 1]
MRNLTSSRRLLRSLFKECFSKKNIGALELTIDIFIKMLENNGYQYTIKYFKGCRLLITRYICGKPLLTNDMKISTVKGFPSKLLFLKKLCDTTNLQDKRQCLTILLIGKYFQANSKTIERIPVSYSSITDPYKGKNWTIPTTFIKKFVEVFKLKTGFPETVPHYLSTKGSPYGKSSIGSFLLHRLEYNILQAIITLLGYQQSWFNKFYTICWNNELKNGVGKAKLNPTSGKLSIVDDPECKKRVIAMIDYHSQWILKSIHNRLMFLLRTLPCDRTYTQDPHNSWSGTSRFHSLDLSSATDRFPIAIQVKLMREIFTHKVALAWRELMVGRAYVNPKGEQLIYKVGQPMGAYSSWACFTLSHHLVVHYCAYLAGYDIGQFKNYIILGDDIVIKHERIAQIYVSMMTRLGVDISFAKTHVSKTTYEFAKRWITPSGEITGIPLGGIGSNLSNFNTVFTILFEYYHKSSPFLQQGKLVDLVVRVYKNRKFGKVLLTERYLKSCLSKLETGLKFSKGILTADQLREFLAGQFKNSEELHLPQGDQIFQLFKDICSHGMIGSIQSTSNKLLRIPASLKTWMDPEMLLEGPIVIAIINSINNSYSKLNEYVEENSKLSLYDAIEGISFIDGSSFDKRRKSIVIGMMSKVLTKGLKTYLPKDGIIMYGSSMGSHSMDSSTFVQSSLMNQEFALMQLKEMVEPPKVSNSWLDFFKGL